MKFRYINQSAGDSYHVARADIREADNIVRCVAYGATVADAEEALFEGLPDAEILDLGSV